MSDDYISDGEEEISYIKLFSQKMFGPASKSVSSDDVIPDCRYYAVTVNISPNKRMNGRIFKDYTCDKQREILLRIENKFRQLNPSVKLEALEFEYCPKLLHQQIHYHALYLMPEYFEYEMITYFDRICKDGNKETKNHWRHIVIEECYDKPGWIQYINKQYKQ